MDRRHGDALRGPRQTAARHPATSCGPRADARPGPRALQLARVLLGDRKCRRTLRLVLVGREGAVAREASGRVTAEAGCWPAARSMPPTVPIEFGGRGAAVGVAVGPPPIGGAPTDRTRPPWSVDDVQAASELRVGDGP